MRKNKVECDVFLYKNQYLMEQPPETKVYTRQYIEGVGMVAILKRKSVLIEIICIIIMIINMLVLICYPALDTEVFVPDSFNCYDGVLFTNIVSSEENDADILIKLLDNSYILEPGERLYSIPIETIPEQVDIEIQSKFFIFNKTKDYTVRVNTVY